MCVGFGDKLYDIPPPLSFSLHMYRSEDIFSPSTAGVSGAELTVSGLAGSFSHWTILPAQKKTLSGVADSSSNQW